MPENKPRAESCKQLLKTETTVSLFPRLGGFFVLLGLFLAPELYKSLDECRRERGSVERGRSPRCREPPCPRPCLLWPPASDGGRQDRSVQPVGPTQHVLAPELPEGPPQLSLVWPGGRMSLHLPLLTPPPPTGVEPKGRLHRTSRKLNCISELTPESRTSHIRDPGL